jgi:hypothetical protein
VEGIVDGVLLKPGARLLHGVAVCDAVDGDRHDLSYCEVPAILSDIKYADFREGYYEGFKQIYEAVK